MTTAACCAGCGRHGGQPEGSSRVGEAGERPGLPANHDLAAAPAHAGAGSPLPPAGRCFAPPPPYEACRGAGWAPGRCWTPGGSAPGLTKWKSSSRSASLTESAYRPARAARRRSWVSGGPRARTTHFAPAARRQPRSPCAPTLTRLAVLAARGGRRGLHLYQREDCRTGRLGSGHGLACSRACGEVDDAP